MSKPTDAKTGRWVPTYSDEEKERAIRLAVTEGLPTARRETGIPKATIHSWVVRSGQQIAPVEISVEARKASLDHRRETTEQRRAVREAELALARTELRADLLGHTRTKTTHGHYIDTADASHTRALTAIDQLVSSSVGLFDGLPSLSHGLSHATEDEVVPSGLERGAGRPN